MPVEAFVIFDVEYATGKTATLKVFRLERISMSHNYDLSDIIQMVNSYVSQNYNCTSVNEIINYIKYNIEDILAVEVFYPTKMGFTMYFDRDDRSSQDDSE